MDTATTTTTPPAQGSGATAAKDSKSTGEGAINSDFDTFLELLTTQLEYQDPLNPMESTEFAVQLATFASVEQQALTNETLDSLTGTLEDQARSEYAGWVGMEALVEARASYDGAPVELEPDIAEGADRATLVVTDASGAEVQRIDLPPGAESYRWSGTTASGASLPAGDYGFTVESYDDGAQIAARPASVYSVITEYRIEGDRARLVLEDGSEVAPEDVEALATPGVA